MIFTLESFDIALQDKAITKVITMVASRISTMKYKIERDDLVQQAYCVLKKNFSEINNKWGGDLNAFCKYALRHHLLNHIRELRKDMLFHSSHLDDNYEEEECTCQELIVESDSQYDLVELKKAMDRLNDQEKIVIQKLYFDGETCKAIGEQYLFVTQQRVDLIKQNALNKLRLYMGN